MSDQTTGPLHRPLSRAEVDALLTLLPECPGCAALRERVAELERQNARLVEQARQARLRTMRFSAGGGR